MLCRVCRGSTDVPFFEDFIEELRHRRKWPKPKSVLIIDYGSIQHSEQFGSWHLLSSKRRLYYQIE